DVLDGAAATGRACAGDREAAARAGGVEHDPVRGSVRGDVLEREPARADVRARDVQAGAGRRVDRVDGSGDVHGAAAGCAEAGAGGRVDVQAAGAERDRV